MSVQEGEGAAPVNVLTDARNDVVLGGESQLSKVADVHITSAVAWVFGFHAWFYKFYVFAQGIDVSLWLTRFFRR